MNTEVSASDIMKGDADSSHPSWLVSLYKKFFKPGVGDKATNVSAAEEVTKSLGRTSIGDTMLPAGRSSLDRPSDQHEKVAENVNQQQPKDQEQIKADLPSTESAGSTEKAMPSFIFPSSYTPVEPTVDQSKNTLVIKNLPFKYKPVDLEALLNEHQAKPKNVRLLRDDAGRFSGMAFIRCISKEEAQRLIFCMNDLDIGGRNIQVEFKMKKKKKGSLRASSDDASSVSSSTEEQPYVNRLRMSTEYTGETPTPAFSSQIQPSLIQERKPAPSGSRKLAVSAEHNFSDKFRKPPQMRRKSTSAMLDTATYSHSALFRIHPALVQATGPSIRPIRQPFGPDGKTNGFSIEYKQSRGHPM